MGEYRAARILLQKAIREAKAGAWEELLQDMDRDPWGWSYRFVLGKLRPSAPPLTESLEPQFVQEVQTLFPIWEGAPLSAPQYGVSPDWTDELEVSAEELQVAVKRGLKGNTTPGPDSIPKRVWALASGIIAEQLRQLLTNCLKLGIFPPEWKRARLVLLHKERRMRKLLWRIGQYAYWTRWGSYSRE